MFHVFVYTVASAYAAVGTLLGLLATYQNREMFRPMKHPFRGMALHAILIGATWPLTASAAISSRR